MRNTFCLFLLVSTSLNLTTGCGDDDAVLPDAGPADVGGDRDAQDVFDGGVDTGPPDAGVDAGRPCDGPPGLYADPRCSVLSAGVLPFNPRYWLWSDGTDKQRFISVPEGSVIDTSNSDAWVFPRGTRIWKNFDLDGRHLETRLFEKNGDGVGIGSWIMRTFQWNESQDGVFEVTEGAENVLGTDHDIPSRAVCVQCHNGRGQPDVPLGFGAIQLNHGDTSITLANLNDMGWLSDYVDPSEVAVPGEAAAQEALGYFHANCSHCHGGDSPMAGLNFKLEVGLGEVRETQTWMTAVSQPSIFTMDEAVLRIAPGDAARSTAVVRMDSRADGVQMPPAATEITDPVGLETVRTWIDSL
jgi:hypothetical protein